METKLVKISQLPGVQIHCSSHIQECRDESEIYNYQRIRLSKNEFVNRILGGGGYAWPGIVPS